MDPDTLLPGRPADEALPVHANPRQLHDPLPLQLRRPVPHAQAPSGGHRRPGGHDGDRGHQ
eukprot:5228377-Heterocapsa_arctica.AAC.1